MDISYGCIYIVTNIINGKKYIGQTVRSAEERWRGHIHEVNCGSQYIFHRAIRKYGISAFIVETLCVCFSLDELNLKEKEYACFYKTFSPHGYNLKAGNGRGSMSDDLKKRISQGLKGKAVYKNAVMASVEKRRGKSLTDEHRKKISIKLKIARNGKSPSEETRRAAYTPESRRKIIQKISGTYFFLSPCGVQTLIINMTQFCRDNNLRQNNMSAVSTGRQKSCKGWRRDPNMGLPQFPGVPELPDMNLPTRTLKTFHFLSPTGEKVSITGLSQFCRDHGLRTDKMFDVGNGKRRSHQGWSRYKSA